MAWQLLASAGYLYRQFDFKAYDTFQTYAHPRGRYDFVPGRTLNYAIEYQIPLLELGMLLNIMSHSTIGLSVAYSPLVEATDKDQHLLRGLVSYGDCEGDA